MSNFIKKTIALVCVVSLFVLITSGSAFSISNDAISDEDAKMLIVNAYNSFWDFRFKGEFDSKANTKRCEMIYVKSIASLAWNTRWSGVEGNTYSISNLYRTTSSGTLSFSNYEPTTYFGDYIFIKIPVSLLTHQVFEPYDTSDFYIIDDDVVYEWIANGSGSAKCLLNVAYLSIGSEMVVYSAKISVAFVKTAGGWRISRCPFSEYMTFGQMVFNQRINALYFSNVYDDGNWEFVVDFYRTVFAQPYYSYSLSDAFKTAKYIKTSSHDIFLSDEFAWRDTIDSGGITYMIFDVVMKDVSSGEYVFLDAVEMVSDVPYGDTLVGGAFYDLVTGKEHVSVKPYIAPTYAYSNLDSIQPSFFCNNDIIYDLSTYNQPEKLNAFISPETGDREYIYITCFTICAFAITVTCSYHNRKKHLID